MHFELKDLPPKMRAQAEAQIRQGATRYNADRMVSRPYPDIDDYRPVPEPPLEPPERRAKYGNRKAARGNLRFDSQKEARRFDELSLLLAAHEIRELKLQPQFTLQEAYTTLDGVRVNAIRYQADFSYERPTKPDCTGTVYWISVVEDVKSAATKTRVYEIKKKLMRERLGIEITEV